MCLASPCGCLNCLVLASSNDLLIQLDKTIARFLKWTVIACFFGLFLLLAFGIVQRSFPAISVSGYDELIDLLFVWLTFAGTAALWREGSLYRVGAFDKIWSPALKRLISIAIHVAMLFLLWILVYLRGRFWLQLRRDHALPPKPIKFTGMWPYP
jgi:TRAP-type C4-dicarboxylate transport system permease small subunit